MEQSFFDFIYFLHCPGLAETFLDVLLSSVPIWLAIMIGLVIGRSWRPRWTGLLYLGLRSKLRSLDCYRQGLGLGGSGSPSRHFRLVGDFGPGSFGRERTVLQRRRHSWLKVAVTSDIYRKFTNALAIAVIVSVGWICYELYFKSSEVYNEQWQKAWIIPAFWQVLSLSLLCVICALWAPSQNSMRYIYSGEASEEFDKDDNTLTLIKPSLMPSKDIRSPFEVGLVASGNNGVSNGDLEEDKTE
ncbi:Transmembrane protein 87B [Camellia lanceoleosa]|uniref:Transmembrane protein 87B n=1 Tax=Camellia lanceoleosa TaxID=1840588 RepID=A0ACC0HSM7_9ERIC|nr:Transmembrane protein 87B [Camellia lanceoleosa]